MRRWTLNAGLLAGLLLESPWSDPELPSLVAVDGGQIIGFTGVQVRRMRFDGRPILGVHSGHGVVSPDRRGGATGALLIGRALSGSQYLTWSDGASDPVAAVFRTFGGQLDHSRACDWMLVLRPARWLSSVTRAVVQRSARERAALRSLVPVGALPFQAVSSGLMRRALPESAVRAKLDARAGAEITGEDASAATIVEHLPALNKGLRLWVDYDKEYLEHLFGLVRNFHGLDSFKGPLFCRLVRRGDRPIGWYAYVARSGGASRVLHLQATKREPEAVLSELISHARAQGSAALAGRAEPHLYPALRHRLAVLGYARQPMIVAKDPELAAVIATSSAVVTRLDGDLFSI
jgi:hypothetical protein